MIKDDKLFRELCNRITLIDIHKLINDFGVNYQDEYGHTALFSAALNGHKEIAELLIKNGANINVQSGLGTTSLMAALKKGHDKVVDVIFQYGANLDIKDNNGNTALFFAARANKKHYIDFFLEKGISLESKDKNDETVLIVAARTCNAEMVEYLVTKGSNINYQDRSGYTALMWSAFNGKYKTVEFLINNGADLNLVNYKGWTALMLAARPISRTIKGNGNTETVELLINTDQTIKNNEGHTALDIATYSENYPVQVLLNSRSINEQDENGDTMLTRACRNKKEKDVIFLQARGADFYIKNMKGESPYKILKKEKHLPANLQALKEKLILESSIGKQDEGDSGL